MLWTGGKDSALALYEAGLSGCRVRCLVTFAPPEPSFLAHPLAFMQMQAQALGLPHHLCPVQKPFSRSYEAGLRWLQDEKGIDTVITGDIAEVGGSPNWIRERSRPLGMNVHTPLWGRDRLILLQQLLASGFKVLFSCIQTRSLSKEWVGRELDETAIADLCVARERTGLDLCGEEGEYHTLVIDGPQFRQRIQIRSYSKCTQNGLVYLDLNRLELVAK